nr:UDP-glycosyltransferase UGT381B1 [Diaphorina citri]
MFDLQKPEMLASHSQLALILMAFLLTVESANVLIICPTPSYSHQVPFIAIGKELVRRGHTVTMIGTDPLKEPPVNYTDIDLSFSYKYFKPQLQKGEVLPDAVDNQRRLTGYEFIVNIGRITIAYTEDQLKSQQMQQFFKYIDENHVKFDLIIYEGLLHTAYLGFLPKLGYPPLIVMQTINPTCLFGLHSESMICNPSYLPEIMSGYTQSMTLMERMNNLFMQLYSKFYIRSRLMKKQDEIMERYFGTRGLSGKQLEENKTLLFISTSWLLTYPRPVFPNTILLGPIHLNNPKPLPQNLKDWIEGAKDGVIYFSLGTNMQSASLQEDKRKAIVDSFKQFPRHRIIWKWEEDILPDLPSNVMCRKWLPQHDILAHPKVKLFIMQGGLQSSQEAIHFGVPMIGIPFFADQDTNVRKLESMDVARFLEYENITAETLVTLMKSILYNETVYRKSQVYSKLSNTQMMSPKDTAVWWIEYVLKAEGNVDHLKYNLDQIPWYQYYLVDLVGIFIAGIFLVVFVLFRMALLLRRLCFRSKAKKKKQ